MNSDLSGTSCQSSGDDCGTQLAEAVGRYVRSHYDAGLRRHLRCGCSVEILAKLLHQAVPSVARAAAFSLGVLGGRASVLPLVGGLHHDDAEVVAAAEEGLWRIWFNGAGVGARRRLLRAAEMIGQERYDSAIAVLQEVLDREPDFAEGYHQRGMARMLMGDWVGAIADYKQAVRLNACHFGALAGMGHAHAQLGQMHEALRCYRATLKIHPRMDGIRQSIRKATHMVTIDN